MKWNELVKTQTEKKGQRKEVLTYINIILKVTLYLNQPYISLPHLLAQFSVNI